MQRSQKKKKKNKKPAAALPAEPPPPTTVVESSVDSKACCSEPEKETCALPAAPCFRPRAGFVWEYEDEGSRLLDVTELRQRAMPPVSFLALRIWGSGQTLDELLERKWFPKGTPATLSECNTRPMSLFFQRLAPTVRSAPWFQSVLEEALRDAPALLPDLTWHQETLVPLLRDRVRKQWSQAVESDDIEAVLLAMVLTDTLPEPLQVQQLLERWGWWDAEGDVACCPPVQGSNACTCWSRHVCTDAAPRLFFLLLVLLLRARGESASLAARLQCQWTDRSKTERWAATWTQCKWGFSTADLSLFLATLRSRPGL